MWNLLIQIVNLANFKTTDELGLTVRELENLKEFFCYLANRAIHHLKFFHMFVAYSNVPLGIGLRSKALIK